MGTKQHARGETCLRKTGERRRRIMFLVSSALSADVLFMRGHVSYLRQQGFNVLLVAPPDEKLSAVAAREHVPLVSVPMARQIRIAYDIVSLWRLWRAMRRLKPDIVNAGTPKAGLLGMLAAWLAGVPIRIYTLRGLRLETTRGIKRWILACCERVASRCAHRVICVSHSLRQAYIRLGLAPPSKTFVLGSGASTGVDVARFMPTEAAKSKATDIRRAAHIPEDAFVIGFVGRIARDKGVHDLLSALELLRRRSPKYHLLCVGDVDSEDRIDEVRLHQLENDPVITITGFVADTPAFYHATDVVALPSYREGFPNVALEASAAALPIVAYSATGTVDAVVDEVTGKLVAIGDFVALANAIAEYEQSPRLRQRHGRAGQVRVSREFSQQVVWQHWCDLYHRLLDAERLATTPPDAPLVSSASETVLPGRQAA